MSVNTFTQPKPSAPTTIRSEHSEEFSENAKSDSTDAAAGDWNIGIDRRSPDNQGSKRSNTKTTPYSPKRSEKIKTIEKSKSSGTMPTDEESSSSRVSTADEESSSSRVSTADEESSYSSETSTSIYPAAVVSADNEKSNHNDASEVALPMGHEISPCCESGCATLMHATAACKKLIRTINPDKHFPPPCAFAGCVRTIYFAAAFTGLVYGIDQVRQSFEPAYPGFAFTSTIVLVTSTVVFCMYAYACRVPDTGDRNE